MFMKCDETSKHLLKAIPKGEPFIPSSFGRDVSHMKKCHINDFIFRQTASAV
jgi:hypothetical protein